MNEERPAFFEKMNVDYEFGCDDERKGRVMVRKTMVIYIYTLLSVTTDIGSYQTCLCLCDDIAECDNRVGYLGKQLTIL